MSTLHTVNKSPFERNALLSCVDHLGGGDAVLLIEDGVLAASNGSVVAPLIHQAMKAGQVYILGPDLAARGFKPENVIEGVQFVDYRGFVELATRHERTVAWL